MTDGVQYSAVIPHFLPCQYWLCSYLYSYPALFLISINSILPILGSLGYFLLRPGLISLRYRCFYSSRNSSGSNFATEPGQYSNCQTHQRENIHFPHVGNFNHIRN